MNFLFAWRYFKARKSTNAINIIAWVSVVAIMLITAAFIVLLSVFNGFEGLVKSLYSSFYADIRVGAQNGKLILVSPEQLKQIAAVPGIRAWTLVAEEKALLQNGDLQSIVQLKGVDSGYGQVVDVPKKIIRGKFETGTVDNPAIVLGGGIENALSADVEKSIYPMTVYLFRRGISINSLDPFESFAAENIIPTGTFFIQQEIDSKFAITNAAFMKRMLAMKPDEYSAIEFAVDDADNTGAVENALKKIFNNNYLVENRYEQNRNLYSVMRLEKWAIYGIVTLMLIVAAFTMIGALTMLVMEKEKDIQVLKALGANRGLVQRIFLSEGALLGVIGAGSGILLGLLICWAQVQFKLVPIQGGTFLIDHYPIQMIPTDFLLIAVTVMVVVLLAAWFPSRRAAMQAVELKS